MSNMLDWLLNSGMRWRRLRCRWWGHKKLANAAYHLDGAIMDCCSRCGAPFRLSHVEHLER